MRTGSLVTLLAIGACGGGSSATPEVVVADVGGAPSVVGASEDSVFWSTGSGSRMIAGAALADLPAPAQALGTSAGPLAHAGDHVVMVSDTAIVRVSVTEPVAKVVVDTAEAVGDSDEAAPIAVWTHGAVVQWGNGDVSGTATLPKIVRCDHVQVTTAMIYVACDGTTERRLLAIDRATSDVMPLAPSSPFGAQFPGGAVDGATYRGRLVGADDDAALWLVDELPGGATSPARAMLFSVTTRGEATVLLEHVGAVGGFFADAENVYWQESDALLTAPRAGGAASIVAHLTGTAGAVADGFVYYADGGAIMRLSVD